MVQLRLEVFRLRGGHVYVEQAVPDGTEAFRNI
jgi:hypothetical protein